MRCGRWTLPLLLSVAAVLLLAGCPPALPPPVDLRARSELSRELLGKSPTLRRAALARALTAYECAGAAGEVGGPGRLLIDYDLPSRRTRLGLLDVERREVLLHDWVAHGQGSGGDRPSTFSNESGSHASSLGLYRVLRPYHGRHGRSLKLRGLSAGFNDNAERRAIVLHGADYVSLDFLRRRGRMGRSWGCPAVRRAVAPDLIRKLPAGTAIFVHRSRAGWLEASPWLRCTQRGKDRRGGSSARLDDLGDALGGGSGGRSSLGSRAGIG